MSLLQKLSGFAKTFRSALLTGWRGFCDSDDQHHVLLLLIWNARMKGVDSKEAFLWFFMLANGSSNRCWSTFSGYWAWDHQQCHFTWILDWCQSPTAARPGGTGPQIVDPWQHPACPDLAPEAHLPESLQPSLPGGLSSHNLMTFILSKLPTNVLGSSDPSSLVTATTGDWIRGEKTQRRRWHERSG